MGFLADRRSSWKWFLPLQKLKPEVVSPPQKFKLEVVSPLQKLKLELVSPPQKLKLEVVSRSQSPSRSVFSNSPPELTRAQRIVFAIRARRPENCWYRYFPA